jgi:hypothetical protein
VFQILFSKLRCRVESQGQYSSSKRTEVYANKTKSDSIHHLYEVFSQLNVFYSGMKLLIGYISDHLKEKKDLPELATSVSVSCEDLLETVNDILHGVTEF